MSVEIIYTDIAPYADAGAEYTATTAAQPFSTLAGLSYPIEPYKVATLEQNYWVLDGEVQTFPDDPTSISFGYMGTGVSNESGDVTDRVTVHFDTAYTVTGITLVFDAGMNEWPEHVKLTWLLDGVAIANGHFYPDSAKYVCVQSVAGFDELWIETINTGLPYRYARLQEVIYGQMITFTQDEFKRVNLMQESSPLSVELPISELDFDIRASTGQSLIFQKRQPMHLYLNGVLQSVTYVDKSKRTGEQFYSVETIDAIGVLDSSDYMGGMFSGERVDVVLSDILQYEFGYELDESFADTVVTGYLPVTTKRQALAQVGYAIGAIISTAGTDKIRILPMQRASSSNITEEEIYSGGELETTSQLTAVELTAHTYEKSDATAAVEVFKGTVDVGVMFIAKVNAPHYDYVVTAGDATVLYEAANYVLLGGVSDDEVIVTAKPYLHSQSMVTKRNPAANIYDQSNVFTIDNATLVNPQIVGTVLNRTYDYYFHREKFRGTAILQDQEVGEMLTVDNLVGGVLTGYLTKLDANLIRERIAAIEVFGTSHEISGVWFYAGTIESGVDGQ